MSLLGDSIADGGGVRAAAAEDDGDKVGCRLLQCTVAQK